MSFFISRNNLLRRLNLLTPPFKTNPLPTTKAGMAWILSLPSLCKKPVIANKISKGAEIEINGLPNLFIKLAPKCLGGF